MDEGTYCPQHRRLTAQTVRAADRFRGTAAERGYGWQWQQERLDFLAKWPVCLGVLTATPLWSLELAEEFHALREQQREAGLVVRYHANVLTWLEEHPIYRFEPAAVSAATVVDHIVPHKGNPELFWGAWNWQPLTKQLHDRKTATEQKSEDRDQVTAV